MKVQMPDYFKRLLDHQQPPCVSVYMPTERAMPLAAESPRRLKGLLRKAENQLLRQYPKRTAEQVLPKLRGLIDDGSFWAHPGDGLAAFASPGFFESIKLYRETPEHVEVADSFHLKPLIRSHQFAGRFQVLCLSQRHVALYEGSQDDLHPVPLRQVPTNIFDALGMKPNERSLGDEARIASISGGEDLDRFVRTIDRAIWKNHSQLDGLPIVLCAVERYHPLFRRITENPLVLREGIKLDPESLSIDRLHEKAWGIIKVQYQRQIEKVIDEYGRARATAQGSDDLERVAEAAAFSRVGTLLVDADKRVGGRIDLDTGRIEFGDISRPDFDDVLDEIAERVLKTGGQVLVMPHDQMPSNSGVAAIYRY